MIAKIQACLKEGTQLGWLIDVDEQTILVLWSDTGTSQAMPLALLTGQATLPTLPELSWDITVWC